VNNTVLFHSVPNIEKKRNNIHFKKVDEANVKLFILHGVHRETYVKEAKKNNVVMSITKLSPGVFYLY
jgi:hypothetical protein